MNKDFHFNTENINSPPAYEDSYTESAVLLADWEWPQMLVPLAVSRKQPLNLRRKTDIQPAQLPTRMTTFEPRKHSHHEEGKTRGSQSAE